jgi:hypothetical protein
MIDSILSVLRTKGPQTIEQLQAGTSLSHDEVCDALSVLIFQRNVYLESDDSMWFVKEAA